MEIIHMHMQHYFVHKIWFEEFVYEIYIHYLKKVLNSYVMHVYVKSVAHSNSVYIMSDNFLMT